MDPSGQALTVAVSIVLLFIFDLGHRAFEPGLGGLQHVLELVVLLLLQEALELL